MKTTSENHDLTRWLDGEMKDDECAAFENRLRDDPVLASEAASLRALSADLRSSLPSEMRVPHADFFNSQIQVRIAQAENLPTAERQRSRSWSLLFRWLQQPWMAAGTAVALAVFALVVFRQVDGSETESLVLSSYAPNANVQARAFHDEAAEATVLLLDGLEAIPADKQISGLKVQRTETELAATTLYDAAGVPMLSISHDAGGNPLIWTRSPQG
jgi:anti-sigma factor RsiW